MTDLQPLLLRPSFLRINLHPLSPSHSRDPNRDRSRAAHPISSEQGNDFVTFPVASSIPSVKVKQDDRKQFMMDG
ncbi:hypothetical protein RRG08_050925 [Elysia crispata]|uniref:Uncharacterized protein n=1 Tax=Elysia crispata TaxID=231223 RepID=A0AAE0YQI9_9GAST|nr:hypothetical protein RRG08_050925 [Elysia crispata]